MAENTSDLYSTGGVPPGPDYHGQPVGTKAKGGLVHERTAVPGRSQGPIDPGQLLALLRGIGDLYPPDSEPPPENSPGFHTRIHPNSGAHFLYLQYPIEGSTRFRQVCVKLNDAADPDIDLPDGGGIIIGGRPIELPIDIGSGSFTVPAGEESRRHTVTLVGFCETVLDFSNVGTPVGYRSVRIPQKYSGGPIAARFTVYTSAAGAGNARFAIRVRAISNGEAIPAMAALVLSPTVAVAAVDTRYETGLTAYFDPSSSPGRGDEFQIEIQRDNTVGGNYANVLWLTGGQIVYPADRNSERALGT